MITLTLDFEENRVHLINEDHLSEHFGEELSVNDEVFVEEISFKVHGSEGADFLELCLVLQLRGKGELSV